MSDYQQLIRRYEPVLRFGRDSQGQPEAFFPMAARDYVHSCGLRRKKVGWVHEPGKTRLVHLGEVGEPDNCYLAFAAGDLLPGSAVDPRLALELLDYDLEIAREPMPEELLAAAMTEAPEPMPRLLLDPQEASELAERLSSITAVERQPVTGDELGAMFGEEGLASTAESLQTQPGFAALSMTPEMDFTLNLEWLKLPNFAKLPEALRDRALEKYEPFRDWALHPPVYHYHVNHDRGYKVLQYWFLYPYNDWASHGGHNDHEGDWEVIFVFLDEEDRPAHVAYSRHVKVSFLYGPATAAWEEIEVVDGTHPVVYVGCGSHASYLQRGDHRFFLHTDWARGDHLALGPEGDQAWGTPISLGNKSWNTLFSGAWGALVKSWIGKAWPNTEGPSGPAQKGDKWHHPAKWAGI